MTVSASDKRQTKFKLAKKDQRIEQFYVRQMSATKEIVLSRQI